MRATNSAGASGFSNTACATVAFTLSTPWTTSYQYDALDNLISVNQQGDGVLPPRNRTFNYDSLSRLTSATNPESGTITYSYDSASGCPASSAGDLIKRVDARNVTTCYQYDALHRLTTKTYSATTPVTPTVTYVYDQSSYNGLATTNGIGRRIGMSDGAGQTAWSYDPLGRVGTKQQTIAGVTKSIVHTYDKAGALSTLTSPNGHVYTYAYNGAGRALSLIDYGNGATYVQNAQYAPPGELTSANHGANSVITESNAYNSRLQPTLLSVASPTKPQLMNFTYSYDQGGGLNNGDVMQINNNRDSSRSTAYTYDYVDRLATARAINATTWGNSYVYDPFGNLLQKNVTQGSGEPLAVTVGANNHIDGFTYDAAGNLTWDTFNALRFDAENRLNPATGCVYSYDGDDHRVQKGGACPAVSYWYDDDSKVISTTGALIRDYVYFNGKRLAFLGINSGLQHYYWSDHLGSASVMSNSNGSTIEWEADYFPFGTERVITNNLENHFLFTGYEFDSEMGYYYANAREQSPNLGRFMSPDPLGGRVADPQTLNKYAYARNNPMNLVDPTGLYICRDDNN